MAVDETLMCSFKRIKTTKHTKKAAGMGSGNKKLGGTYGKKYMAKYTWSPMQHMFLSIRSQYDNKGVCQQP